MAVDVGQRGPGMKVVSSCSSDNTSWPARGLRAAHTIHGQSTECLTLLFLVQVGGGRGADANGSGGGGAARGGVGAVYANSGFSRRRSRRDVAVDKGLDGSEVVLRGGVEARGAGDIAARRGSGAGRGCRSNRGGKPGGDGRLRGAVCCESWLQGPPIVGVGAVSGHRPAACVVILQDNARLGGAGHGRGGRRGERAVRRWVAGGGGVLMVVDVDGLGGRRFHKTNLNPRAFVEPRGVVSIVSQWRRAAPGPWYCGEGGQRGVFGGVDSCCGVRLSRWARSSGRPVVPVAATPAERIAATAGPPCPNRRASSIALAISRSFHFMSPVMPPPLQP